MNIEYSKSFIKQFRKCPGYIRDAFKIKIRLLLADPFSLPLNNHALCGKLNGYRSINVTGDCRAIFQMVEPDKIAYFIAIGTHSQLYGH